MSEQLTDNVEYERREVWYGRIAPTVMNELPKVSIASHYTPAMGRPPRAAMTDPNSDAEDCCDRGLQDAPKSQWAIPGAYLRLHDFGEHFPQRITPKALIQTAKNSSYR